MAIGATVFVALAPATGHPQPPSEFWVATSRSPPFWRHVNWSATAPAAAANPKTNPATASKPKYLMSFLLKKKVPTSCFNQSSHKPKSTGSYCKSRANCSCVHG
jgi:hypothetical protein